MTMFAPLLITDVGLPEWPPRNPTGVRAVSKPSPANLNHSDPAAPMTTFEPLPFSDALPDDERPDLDDLIDNANDVEGMLEDLAKSAAAAYGEACRLSVRIGLVVAENRRLSAENAELQAALRVWRGGGQG